MKDFDWLHFSDLHLNSDDLESKNAREELIDYIKNERDSDNLPFKYIFITGDIADKSDYAQTHNYLNRLFEALDLKCNEHGLANVFWAVGNHDIKRDSDSQRHLLIQRIRLDRKNSEYISLDKCLSNPEKRGLLAGSGMDLYKENYLPILHRVLEANEKKPHFFVPLDDLNLIVLNTCLTSADDYDTHNLFIYSEQLVRVFKEVKDKKKPLFVIGHHGRDFFSMDEFEHLSNLFDSNGVDVYLCGHNHRLGFSVFPDTERDIYQLTCGGGPNLKKESNFSFMRGHFNCSDKTIQIISYSYHPRLEGWIIDNNLSRRLTHNNSFDIKRLQEMTRNVQYPIEYYPDTFHSLSSSDPSSKEDCVNILHLSDLQFGITKKSSDKKEVAIQSRKAALEELIYFLDSSIPIEWKPDIVVISGDLAWKAANVGYGLFASWLTKLMKALDLKVDRLIVCTGNHDIDPTAAQQNSENLTDEKKANEELVEEKEEIYKKFSGFISFCKGEIDEDIHISPLDNILSEGSDGKYLYGFREILGICFSVLNTAWYCGDKRNKEKKDSSPDKEHLWIGKDFVQDLETRLLRNDKFAVTVFHHPFDWLAPEEGDDSSSVKRCILRLSDIILCGHVHSRVGDPTFEQNRTQVFQSGALWEGDKYVYESRIIKVNKKNGSVRQLTLEYNADGLWKCEERTGPNRNKTYPIYYHNRYRHFSEVKNNE